MQQEPWLLSRYMRGLHWHTRTTRTLTGVKIHRGLPWHTRTIVQAQICHAVIGVLSNSITILKKTQEVYTWSLWDRGQQHGWSGDSRCRMSILKIQQPCAWAETLRSGGWDSRPQGMVARIHFRVYILCYIQYMYIYIYIEREHITHHVFLGIPLYSPAFKSGLGPIWATVGRLSRRDTYNTWLWTGVRHFPAWVESPRHRDLR